MVNIPKAAREVGVIVERNKALQEYRRKKSDRKDHVFSMSVNGFKAKIYLGIQSQRGKKLRITESQDKEITKYIERYAAALYSIFSKKKSESGIFEYSMLGGKANEFKVRISGDGNIGQHLVRIREQAGLRAVSNSIKNSFKDVAEYKNIAIDISHMDESTIASQYATDVLQKYESEGFIPKDKNSYEKLKVMINYDPKSKKTATVYTEDTFWYLNQSTTEEAQVSALLAKAVEESWLQKNAKLMAEEVASYKSRELTKIAAKKIKGSKIKQLDKEPKASKATYSTTINHRSKKKPTFSAEHFTDKIQTLQRSQPENWSLLIPKINALLHNKIRANMIAPRLIYRTGAFARSVEVTRVEETRQGYPVFIADYDRDPYQVFDNKLGKPPWNIPTRDPKSLIDKSVRDVMRELAIGRFYVRTPGSGVSK
jgi:hypothetical protein